MFTVFLLERLAQSAATTTGDGLVGTLVRASATEDKQRISTVVAAPCAGLASSEQANNM